MTTASGPGELNDECGMMMNSAAGCLLPQFLPACHAASYPSNLRGFIPAADMRRNLRLEKHESIW
jgi:hypothetical protein